MSCADIASKLISTTLGFASGFGVNCRGGGIGSKLRQPRPSTSIGISSSGQAASTICADWFRRLKSANVGRQPRSVGHANHREDHRRAHAGVHDRIAEGADQDKQTDQMALATARNPAQASSASTLQGWSAWAADRMSVKNAASRASSRSNDEDLQCELGDHVAGREKIPQRNFADGENRREEKDGNHREAAKQQPPSPTHYFVFLTSGAGSARIDSFPSVADRFGHAFDLLAAVEEKRKEDRCERGQNLPQESTGVGVDVGPAFAAPRQDQDERDCAGYNRGRAARVWHATSAAVSRSANSSMLSCQFAWIFAAIHSTRLVRGRHVVRVRGESSGSRPPHLLDTIRNSYAK